MSSLFASLATSSNSLSSISRALDVVQENINNASTPGYAKQDLSLEAGQFNIAGGLLGGLRYGDVISSRDQYADQEVRQQVSAEGFSGQQVDSLGTIESLFDVTGNSGIDGAMSSLIQSFSAWSTSPNDANARQSVLDSAATLAQSFQAAASGLTGASVDSERQIGDTVTQINQITTQIRDDNVQLLKSSGNDPGLEANLTASLESLAQLTDFTAVKQQDGTTSVMLAGGTPLVLGNQQYALASESYAPANPTYAAAPLSVRIVNSDGVDVSSQVSGGQLGALIDFRNNVIPGLIGDSSQPGTLNTLAKAFAGRVNSILQAGQTDTGQAGAPLFVYSANDTGTAASLEVNPNITAGTLAAIDPGPPSVANGAALSLAALNDGSTNNQVDGVGFVKYYGIIAAGVGRDVSTAQDANTADKQAVTQARSFQSGISGVSLDDEAVQLMQLQRSYQAMAQTITVLDQLSQTALNMIQE
jgi:flagellar hook-associated protein 1